MSEQRRFRLLWTVPALAIPAYLGICFLLYSQQRALIYFPQATHVPAQATDFMLHREDAVLRGWLLQPQKTDVLLYFGGNAERVELSRTAFSQYVRERSVYLLPYRGYGASDGAPSEAALFGDALALFDEVRRRHPHGRIAVMGRSLGSGIASYVAAHRRVDRLILVTPFDSLADVAQTHYRWLPVDWLIRDRYESFRYLPRHAGELLILRAGRDSVVPPAHTDRLIAAGRRPPRVVDFPEADHNNLSEEENYWQAIEAFLAMP